LIQKKRQPEQTTVGGFRGAFATKTWLATQLQNFARLANCVRFGLAKKKGLFKLARKFRGVGHISGGLR